MSAVPSAREQIAQAVRASGKLPRRHPAEVTSDRLGDHLDRWYETTDGDQRDAIAKVRDWLQTVAEGGAR